VTDKVVRMMKMKQKRETQKRKKMTWITMK
jgi:hypothetical protein